VIEYAVGSKVRVTIDIYDVAGRRIRTLVDQIQAPGVRSTTWDGRNTRGERVASGVYFYRMSAAKFVSTHKLVLLR